MDCWLADVELLISMNMSVDGSPHLQDLSEVTFGIHMIWFITFFRIMSFNMSIIKPDLFGEILTVFF